MKITYIHHSSFLVETEENYFLFDYFEGKLPQLKAVSYTHLTLPTIA